MGVVRTVIHERVEEARRGRHPGVIARMDSGWGVMGDSQFLRGYCLLLPDPVVVSLNELDERGRAAYLLDMARLGDAVMRVCSPRRMNYEILGNLEPALHAHVIARYEEEDAAFRTKPYFLYPAEVRDAKEHAFDPARHGGLMREIAGALK